MPTTKTIRIAIVEDDKYYNNVLTKYISTICSKSFFPGIEFRIVSYQSGHDFLEHIDEKTDILLLDYYLFNADELEQINGEDVLRVVKQYLPGCKVILLSALTDPFKLQKLHSEGILAHVDKNVSSTNRVGAILQQTISEYHAHAS